MYLHIIWVVFVKCELDITIVNKSVSDPNLINGFLKTYTNYFSFHAPVQCFMYSLTFWLHSYVEKQISVTHIFSSMLLKEKMEKRL